MRNPKPKEIFDMPRMVQLTLGTGDRYLREAITDKVIPINFPEITFAEFVDAPFDTLVEKFAEAHSDCAFPKRSGLISSHFVETLRALVVGDIVLARARNLGIVM